MMGQLGDTAQRYYERLERNARDIMQTAVNHVYERLEPQTAEISQLHRSVADLEERLYQTEIRLATAESGLGEFQQWWH